MSKNIRGQYIKNLVADKDALSEQLKANTEDSLRSLLQETVKESLRGILNEDDDKEEEENSFKVEEVGTENDTEKPAEDTTSDVSIEDTSSTDVESGENTEDVAATTVETPAEDGTDSEATENDDMWKGLEQFKGENGEYDLTGMGSEDVIKVLKVMGPEDSVRLVKNDNGSVTLTDDETQKEYIIDLDGSLTSGNDNETAETSSEETTEEIPMNEENLGYTDNYQNKTAMTTPSNNEPGKNVNTWDKGVPQGTEKPWVGKKGNMAPFEKKVNEGENECNNECGSNCLYEIEIDTDVTDNETTMDEQSRFGKANEKGMHKTPKSSEDHTTYGSHVISREGTYTGNEPNGKVNENQELSNMIRKANAILSENNELKKIANELRAKIEEAVVINSSLAKVINLVTENSTTRNEKIDILNRFNAVKTLDESRTLYETISRELKNAHAVNNGTKLINEQVNTGKTKATETQIYKSDDLNETINFMHRMDRLGKR